MALLWLRVRQVNSRVLLSVYELRAVLRSRADSLRLGSEKDKRAVVGCYSVP